MLATKLHYFRLLLPISLVACVSGATPTPAKITAERQTQSQHTDLPPSASRSGMTKVQAAKSPERNTLGPWDLTDSSRLSSCDPEGKHRHIFEAWQQAVMNHDLASLRALSEPVVFQAWGQMLPRRPGCEEVKVPTIVESDEDWANLARCHDINMWESRSNKDATWKAPSCRFEQVLFQADLGSSEDLRDASKAYREKYLSTLMSFRNLCFGELFYGRTTGEEYSFKLLVGLGPTGKVRAIFEAFFG